MRSFGGSERITPDPSMMESKGGAAIIKNFEEHRVVEIMSLMSTSRSSDFAAESAESDYDEERQPVRSSGASQASEASRRSVKEVIEKLRRMRTTLHNQIASDASVISELTKQMEIASNESVVSDLDGSFCVPPNRAKSASPGPQKRQVAQKGGVKGAFGKLVNRGRKKKEDSPEDDGDAEVMEVIGVVPRVVSIDTGSVHQKAVKSTRRDSQLRDDTVQHFVHDVSPPGTKPPLFPKNRRRWLRKCGPTTDESDRRTETKVAHAFQKPGSTGMHPNVPKKSNSAKGKEIFFDPDEYRDLATSNLDRYRSAEEREGPPESRNDRIGKSIPLNDVVRKSRSEDIGKSHSYIAVERKKSNGEAFLDGAQKLHGVPPLPYVANVGKSASKRGVEHSVSSMSLSDPHHSMSSGEDRVSNSGCASSSNSSDDELSELMGDGIDLKDASRVPKGDPKERVISPFFDFLWCFFE